MRTEFVYSIIALGAIPVVANAADAKQIDAIVSVDGAKQTINVGKLVPGSYTFSAKLTSKVYGVTVKIAGKTVDVPSANNPKDPNVTINFDLDKETDVELELVSSDPGESGAGFTVAEAVVILNFDLAAAKAEWADAINALKTTQVAAYDYDDDEEKADKDAADKLIAKLNKIADTYEEYVAQKLYQKASVPQGEIDALEAQIKGHQNTQAYNNVNAAITAIKAKYNDAVADLKAALVNEAAYLLDAALKDLDDNINKKITDATQASYASYTGKTAVADEDTNVGMIPTEKALNDIVNNWKGQGTTNQAAYDALHKKVTDQQAALDAAVPEESVASLFPKTDAQAAIDALNTKIENAKNSAAQLTLDVTKEEAAAQKAVGDYATKVGTANAEYKANEATVAAIKTLQDNLDAAKAAVNAMKSADGNYEAKNYYDAYVADIQKDINKFSTDAAAAYKADGTGTAQAYNAALNTAPTQAKIDVYGGTTEPAVDGQPKKAVDKYDALQTAMASYQKDLDAARAQVEDLAVYNDDKYDYQTKFDLIQKRINDIKKAITAAQGKVGAEHWTAMLAIDADAAITDDIAALLSKVQADQNQYDADFLANGMKTLEENIDAFKAKDASVLGADVAKFQAIESGIETAYNDVKTAKNAINASSETVDYTAKVSTDKSAWSVGSGNGSNKGTYPKGGITLIEHYGESGVGNMIWQDVSVENGIYEVQVYATSHNAWNNYGATLQEDANDVAYVFANDNKKFITARRNSGMLDSEPEVYTISDVVVTNGKLTIGLALAKAGQTEWHTLQIKSLKANTASLIQGWGAKVAELNDQQDALESLVEPIAAKVAANAKAKSDLATSIDGLQTKTGTFKNNYKIGTDDTTLGNRGKAGGAITKEVEEIETALNTLETTNNSIDPTAISDVDKTDKVNKDVSGWNTDIKNVDYWTNYQNQTIDGVQMVEHWCDKSNKDKSTGDVLYQTVTNLPNGLYSIVVYANAVDQGDGCPNKGKTDIAYFYANGKKVAVPVTDNASSKVDYTLNDVIVSDGTLKFGLNKAKGGTNWHSMQIKSLTYRENDQLSKYNNEDPENLGLNNKYTALAAQEAALEKAAPDIKTAVENNAKSNTAAQKAVADLGTYELDNLKSLADVSKADASYNGKKGNAVRNEDVTGWEDFYVYQSGLDADKSYNSEKGAVDATIAAMTAAINAANAAETLPYPWNDEITVTTEDDPTTPDVNEASSTTYKVSEIKAAVDAIKAEAANESANYWAYRNIYSGKNSVTPAYQTALTAANTDLETAAGAGALAYYQGVIAGYETEFANIEKAMRASIYARTAVADADTHKKNINALTKKLNDDKNKAGVQYDAKANLAKYNEQKKAAADVQTLWNSTYTEIAATDHSSKRDEWLNELDKIQITLTAATQAVEDNYKVGESVAKAQDFAAIKAAINDVKAQQQEAYNAQIAEDNKIAHESFMGTDTKKGQIQLATEAYQRAVAERAQYSSTNEEIKAAVDAAAAELDEALYSCPTDIATLTQQENEAYAAVVSPTVFDVSPYNTQALTIEQNITAKLNTFKADVKTAISNFWTGADYKPAYAAKVAAAEGAISGYSADAKKDAFKDVKDLIAKGDAGVASITLSEVEVAIEALEDIDDMLAADKDAAAAKDISAAVAAANKAYSDTKTYIEGKTIADDVNNVKATQLQNLEDAKQDADATLEAYPEETWTFDNHDDIKPTLANVVTVANDAKTAVDNAIVNDKANTKAYEEIVAATKPVTDKLAEAEAAAAPYKYSTSFDTEEEWLHEINEWADDSKANGNAVADKNDIIHNLNDLSAEIEVTLTTAFGTEKAGLKATDIPELKNQFNAYVATNGLNETATQFKKDIDALEKAVDEAEIKDLDKTPDGIQYDEILDATAKLVALQNDIANKESELLEANASAANAEVLADFNTQIGKLEKTASLEGYAEWVAVQPYGGTTLGAAIEGLKTQIADVKTAVNAEPNIAFYKDQYQKKIDDIKADLDPVAEEIAEKQAQFDANAAAYTKLTAEINQLQGNINAAKEKVGGYKYVGHKDQPNYISYIEEYDPNDPTKLTGGAQKKLNDAKGLIDNWNGEKFLTEETEVPNKAYIVNRTQRYLDYSAYAELNGQSNNLYTELANAIQYKAETYSPVLWQRLIDEKDRIDQEIDALSAAIEYSYQTYKWDEEQQDYVLKDRTSDADYATQKAEVDRIQGEIDDLHEVFENLDILGDANVDGRVNVLDYQKVVNMILDPRLQPAEDTDLFANIDINQSDVIEVGDLTAIVNYILYQNWHGNAAARSFNRGDNENLSLNYSSVNSDVQRIAVNLENANNYTAFQMDVVLPDGMKIVGTSLSSRAGQSHKLYSRTQQDGSVRILASSISGETFSGNEGAVLYIDVEGANASSVEILNILFSDVNANTRAFKLGNNVTGIDAIGSTFDALKQKVYDLGGRVMNGVKKGINIIRNADGSTRKVAE